MLRPVTVSGTPWRLGAGLVVGLALAGAAVAGPSANAARRPDRGHVAVYLTTADGRLKAARRPSLPLRSGSVRPGPESVLVNPGRRYQPLSAGFGVAMTDTSAFLLRERLPAARREQVMRRLFSRRDGIGLSYLRIPMGASDYVVGRPYTYDDVPRGQRDPELRRFSLAHDRRYVLPMVRRALALNPAMTVMMNPWTPPAWMKTDESLIPSGKTTSRLRADAYGPLARYLVKVLQGYRAAGVPVQQLGVQNEPLNPLLSPGIPGMTLPAADEARLIRDHVAPALRRARLRARILAWDFVYPRGPIPLDGATTYVPDVMRGAGRDVDGLAFHCYFSDASTGSELHRRYPRTPQFQTECASYLSDVTPAQMSIRSLRNWAQGVQLWNAALDQRFGPKIGTGCRGVFGPHAGQECIAPVIVDERRRTYRLTSDYWALAQFSRFIRLGARRIASTPANDCRDGVVLALPPCGLENVAFRNPDGSRVLVATTDDGRRHTLSVAEGGRRFSFRVPDGAIATFVWR